MEYLSRARLGVGAYNPGGIEFEQSKKVIQREQMIKHTVELASSFNVSGILPLVPPIIVELEDAQSFREDLLRFRLTLAKSEKESNLPDITAILVVSSQCFRPITFQQLRLF